MEQIPGIRVVGNASPEKKETAVTEIQQVLTGHLESLTPEDRLRVEKFEYPKTDKERALLDFVIK